MSVVEEEEDVIFKGGPLHAHLVNSGFTDFEVFDKTCSNDSTEFNFFEPSPFNNLLEKIQDAGTLQTFIPAFYEDFSCYDRFLNTLFNSSIVRAEAEYWLRNLRNSFKVKHIKALKSEDSLSVWQSPFSFLVEKPLLVFFLVQGGFVAYRKILLQQRLIILQRLLASLEVFNRKLGMAVHLSQQGEMSQRFLSATFNDLAESFVLKSSPNGVFRIIQLLKSFAVFLKRSLEEMHLANPLPAEFDCRQTLLSLKVPSCYVDEQSLSYRDLKEIQQYYKEVLTIFTHQLAMNFIAQAKQDGACKVEDIFPILHRITLATMQCNVELKETIDILRGVNLLMAPPKVDLRNGDAKRFSLHVNPLIPAIESSGIHLRNALSFILNTSDVSETELGNVVQILQASRVELAAADSFLHKAEILVNRLNKTKDMSVKKDESLEPKVNGNGPIPLDFSSNLSSIGDPFLEEVFQGTSFSHSLEWDNGEGEVDDSHDSASSAYYQHLMNELQCVLVSKGKSRITPNPLGHTPQTPSTSDRKETPNIVTSTPFVKPRSDLKNSSLELTPLAPEDSTTSIDTIQPPTPQPRSKYAQEKLDQITFVSPSTLNGSSPMPIKDLANLIAQKAQRLDQIEETFEDETVFEDAEEY